MYFEILKCILALAPAASETVVVPSVFEEFMGTSAIAIQPAPESSYCRIETLVLASDLGDGPMTLHRIGLRFKDLADGPRRLRGTVTLSRTTTDRLSERYSDNLGDSPVTFFVEGKLDPGAPQVLGYLVYFDLAPGLRFDPSSDGNLRVGLEIQANQDIRLDAAPTETTRLLVSPDFLAPSGTLTHQVPVMIFVADRERPLAPIERMTRIARAQEQREAPAPAPPESGIAAQMGALETKVATLQRSLEHLAAENQRLVATLDATSRSLAALVAEQGVQYALASGNHLLLRPRTHGGRLETAHAVVRNAILAAREDNLDVRDAESLIKQAKLESEGGEFEQAFATYALAFQSLVADSPANGRRAAGAPSDERPLTAHQRATPYDVR